MGSRAMPGLALLVVLLCGAAVRADEIRLKDGTKISGTIVGFENGSFRVETSYGFALIEKDKVADINIVAAKKEPEPKTKPNAPAALPPVAPPAVVPAVAKEPAASTGALPEPNAAPKPKPVVAAAPPAAAPAPPPAPPAPL